MQALSLKLGVATERDLAQACRTAYRPWINVCLWIIMEVRTTALSGLEAGKQRGLLVLTAIAVLKGSRLKYQDSCRDSCGDSCGLSTCLSGGIRISMSSCGLASVPGTTRSMTCRSRFAESEHRNEFRGAPAR